VDRRTSVAEHDGGVRALRRPEWTINTAVCAAMRAASPSMTRSESGGQRPLKRARGWDLHAGLGILVGGGQLPHPGPEQILKTRSGFRSSSHLSTRHGRACPGHPDDWLSASTIEVAGTSPAMTRFYGLIQNDRKPL
jgi:hypothetical protein